VRLSLVGDADAESIAPLVRDHLARGQLLAYPTETVYGLGSAPEDGPLQHLARLKGRRPGKPFLLLVSGRSMAASLGLVFTASAAALADAFWPGPLTLVLAGGEGRLPAALRGPEGGIAVRHTSHAALARLIGAVGHPLTSTSANRPGSAPAPGADGVEALFPDECRRGALMLLDGGVLGNVPPSTLVDCTTPVPAVIRDGALPREELRRRVGRLAP
jgi:L-threonylcarbamoyladenylate synthase